MRDLRRADPKRIELQNDLYVEQQKALRQYFSSLDFKTVGRQKQLSVFASPDMCKTSQQIPRRLVKVGSNHLLKGQSFFLEQR